MFCFNKIDLPVPHSQNVHDFSGTLVLSAGFFLFQCSFGWKPRRDWRANPIPKHKFPVKIYSKNYEIHEVVPVWRPLGTASKPTFGAILSFLRAISVPTPCGGLEFDVSQPKRD